MMISLRDVRFSYDQRMEVLAGVSFDIGPGLTLLLGPNGAGKSTVLKIIAGVERPDAGVVKVGGFDLWKDEVAAREQLAYVSEYPDLTPYATVRDVIHLVCRLRSQPREAAEDALVRVGLGLLADRSIRELSMGQRRRAVLAAAWIGSPKVVVLDEPLEAMDRLIRKAILDWIDHLIRDRATVVIATHQIEPFIEKVERAIVLRGGSCRSIDALPGELAKRMEFLESMAAN